MRNALLAIIVSAAAASAAPKVFPEPKELAASGAAFQIGPETVIALPQAPTAADRYAASVLSADLADRFGVAVRVAPLASVKPGASAILIGASANPSIGARAAKLKLRAVTQPEGYALQVTPSLALVAGADARGAFYGMQTLRQLVAAPGREIPGVRIRDWPSSPFRGVKLYLPGRDNIPYFKRFVRDFMALYKFNNLVLELNAAMRFDRHPELNAGWIEFARDLNYSRRERPEGPRRENQDSSHQDTGDGAILEKAEVAELVRWSRLNHVEVMPEIPSLTHSYYLLTRHPELAENAGAEWPDTYCPSLPGSYKLLFDVFDEYIEVMKPAMIHIGHDEWRMPWGLCPRCKSKHFGDVFGEDVVKIHKYLASKGVKTAMWGDHLIPRLRGEDGQPRKTPTGFEYRTPGGLTPEQVKKWIPKDILIFNWFWNDGNEGQGEINDKDLEAWGFSQVYGNMEPSIPNYGARVKRRGVLGGAPSSWAATTEFNFGKDLLDQFLGTAEMLWTGQSPQNLMPRLREMMPEVRERLSGRPDPSQGIDQVTALDLPGGNAEAARQAMPGAAFQTAPVVVGVEGANAAPWPRQSAAIPVGEDVTSVLFLHASAKPAGNAMSYRAIFNFADTADLLGWYKVVYEDGYELSVPLRYGVNIQAWNDTRSYCYEGAPMSMGEGATFYSWEWANPRLGKAIKEIRLEGSSGFTAYNGRKAAENTIVLAGVKVVKKRPFPEPVKAAR